MATKTKITPATTQPTAIPSAVRDNAASAPAAKANPADLLKALAGKKAVTKSSPASKGRPEVNLTPEAEKTMRAFAPAKTLFDHFEAHLDNLKAEVKELVFPLYVKSMWVQKSQPANPAIKVARESDGKPDIETTYIVQEKYKVNADSPEAAKTLLKDLGVPAADAIRLVDNEIDFDPMSTLRPFNELVKGHKEGEGWVEATEAEKSVATKLLEFVMALPDAERDLILRNEPNVVVKSGFLERVAGYAQTEAQLAAIFQIVAPVAYARGGKFAISDSLDEKNTRLLQEAAKILGTELGIE
jgi:hypothetical protein